MKKLLYFVLILSLISGINATAIDLNDNGMDMAYSNLVNEINKYPAIHSISKYYNTIALSIDNYSVVLEFKDSKLQEIRNNNNEIVDLELSLSKQEADYLLDNWKTMSYFSRFKYVFKACENPSDALILGGIAMSFRGEI